VAVLVNGCKNVMATIDMLDRPLPPDAVRFFAEDDRPGSGHLQICHPAPADGLFESGIELGSRIDASSPVGYFTADGARDRVVIPAQTSGRLVAIRSWPRVAVSDGLAVVVEFTETGE
jgi:predicted deacylase